MILEITARTNSGYCGVCARTQGGPHRLRVVGDFLATAGGAILLIVAGPFMAAYYAIRRWIRRHRFPFDRAALQASISAIHPPGIAAEGKDTFVQMMHALAGFCQVQVLTYCVMDNHFHLLLRVPPRPADFDLPLEEVQRRWRKAVGKEWSAAVKSQHEIFRQAGAQEAIEAWRQRMLGRMFRLSEFMKALKQRFTQWYNQRHERRGTLWESRYTSVIVEDEVRSLRTMATYIDLNPVRAGCGEDPADYRWCGYAAAMAGVRGAQQGLARVVHGGPMEERTLFPAVTQARRMRALVEYRRVLGVRGRPRVREDGKVVKRGVSAAVQARLESRGSAAVGREVLRRRIVHLTRGVIFGSRGFIDEWFERNRAWFGGRSRKGRRSGARSTGENDLRGLYTLRKLDLSG